MLCYARWIEMVSPSTTTLLPSARPVSCGLTYHLSAWCRWAAACSPAARESAGEAGATPIHLGGEGCTLFRGGLFGCAFPLYTPYLRSQSMSLNFHALSTPPNLTFPYPSTPSIPSMPSTPPYRA